MKENNGRKTGSDVDTNRIADFCRRNVKYISAGVLLAALVAVIAVTTLGDKDEAQDPEQEVAASVAEGDGEDAQDAQAEYEVDVPEVKELVSTYYNSYAAGDVDKLSSITQSLSDMEKSYIKMMNEYVEGYNDITCYTKPGSEEGSYLASVAFSMKFHNVDGDLPGMDFFYIRTNDKGDLYIDNLYSSFNREIQEQSVDDAVEKEIQAFEDGEDVQELLKEFQDKYNAAIDSDADLKNMVDQVAEAIKGWASSYSADSPTQTADASDQAEQPADESGGADSQDTQDAANTDSQDAAADDTQDADAANTDSQDAAADDTQDADAANTDSQDDAQDADSQDTAADDTQDADTDSQDTDDGSDNSGLNYVPEGKVLTASSGYNVRASMSETAEVLGVTAVGDEIKVVLSYAEGWTKVEWGGKTGYIRTDLLLNN